MEKEKFNTQFTKRLRDVLQLLKKILNTVEDTFIKYGFVPLETPPMEISSNIGSFLPMKKKTKCQMFFL